MNRGLLDFHNRNWLLMRAVGWSCLPMLSIDLQLEMPVLNKHSVFSLGKRTLDTKDILCNLHHRATPF